MALRLIEIVLPEDTAKDVQDVLVESQVNQVWLEKNSDKQILIQLLVPAQKSEAVLDVLEKRFSTREGFTIVLLPVEAALPRTEEPEPETSYPENQASSGEPAQKK